MRTAAFLRGIGFRVVDELWAVDRARSRFPERQRAAPHRACAS
ncbi:hypothetical protein SFR_2566 [Streptomyces sp. FR-008]|nr:hypothetical protein SFR_2566 [Streptomyces sp. FR-008]